MQKISGCPKSQVSILSPYVKIFRDCKTFVYDAICSIFKLKEF